MLETWKSRWSSLWANGRILSLSWLLVGAVLALYFGTMRVNLLRTRGVARATGLAGLEEPEQSAEFLPPPQAQRAKGVVGGVPGGIASDHNGSLRRASLLGDDKARVSVALTDAAEDRKMVRSSSLEMVVQRPAEAAEQIRALAEGMGGFLVSSEMSGGGEATGGSLTIRVPAARYEEARAAIRKLGLRVESEKIEAQDVTRQYVDEDANLRNLRAEEAQFLGILKRATTVKDTLEVSEKLSDVRGEIDQQQAEFDALSKQIATVAITVTLRAEVQAQVFGLDWRPLYQAKLALRDGLDGIADYGTSMMAFVFYLPAVLLWAATIIVGAAVSWKLLRWAARTFFAWPKQHAVQNS